MAKSIALVFVSLAVFANGDSDNSKLVQIPNHYLDLGCTPITEAGSPTRVECPVIPRDGKCHNRGKSYNVGDEIPDGQHPICKASCHCYDSGGHIDFNCANIECPELFTGPPVGCVRQERPGKCCPRYECDKEKIAELSKTTCFVNGNQYVKGQVMYPDSHSCYTCICDSGFDNQTIVDSRHCKKVDCNVEFHYSDNIARGCIPIYYKDASCCPIGWRCPDSSDTVATALRSSEDSSDPKSTCVFGQLKLAIGDEMNSSDEKVSCKCLVPPQPHCIQKPYEP